MATITGTAGQDNLTGTSGGDLIDGAGGADTINAGDGDDIVRLVGTLPVGNTHYAMLDGGNGYDVLDLTGWQGGYLQLNSGSIAHYDVVNDVQIFSYIARFTGFEEIRLGPAGGSIQSFGSDPYNSPPETLPVWKVLGGAGADYIGDSHGNEVIAAGGGNDVVTHTGGNDQVTLGDGDDQYQLSHSSGYAEHPTVDGGAGTDLLTISDLTAVEDVTVDLEAGTGQMQRVSLAVTGIENLSIVNNYGVSLVANGEPDLALPWHAMAAGGEGDNVINVQSVGDAIVLGRGGDDQIFVSSLAQLTAYGGSGNDRIEASDGNDWINGDGHYSGDAIAATTADGGADTLNGEGGNDHIFGNSQWAVAGSMDGADSIRAGFGMDYVNGNAGNDTIVGEGGPDRLYGGAGDDLVWGDDSGSVLDDGGNDHINGNKGNDTLHGGSGNDEILGGQGDDVIDGGEGLDTLSGNAGTDIFYLNGSAHFATSGPQANLTDIVTDYQDGQDRFEDFYRVVAVLHPGAATDFTTALALAGTVLPAINFTASVNEDVAAVQVGADTYLFFNNQGHGPESAVRLLDTNAATIDTGDFVWP